MYGFMTRTAPPGHAWLRAAACHRVVELLEGHTPVDHDKIVTVTLVVALGTMSSGFIRSH